MVKKMKSHPLCATDVPETSATYGLLLDPLDMPLADLRLLTEFHRSALAGEIRVRDAAVKYTLRYCRYVRCLAANAPDLLAKEPTERFAAGLHVYAADLRERRSAAGAADELRTLRPAVAYILPDVPGSIFAEVIRDCGEPINDGPLEPQGEPWNLRDEDLDRKFPDLVARLGGTLPIVNGRRKARLSPASIKKGRQHLCEYLGAVTRRGSFATVSGPALFDPEIVEVFISDVLSRSPSAAAGRLRNVRSTIMRVDPDGDYDWMDERAKELAALHPDPARPAKEKHIVCEAIKTIPAADEAMLTRCLANDTPEAIANEWTVWSSAKIGKVREAYTLFLGSVERIAPQRLERSILDRLSPEVVEQVIKDQRVSCSEKTIAGRLREIRRLLGRAFPDADLSALSERAHELVRFRVRVERIIPMAKVSTLIEAAFSTMDDTCERLRLLVDKPPLFSLRPLAERYRDALMTAFLTLMAPRAKNFAAFRLGTTFLRTPSGFKYEFEDMKNGTIEFKNIPEPFVTYIEGYLSLVRNLISSDAPEDAFWVSNRGAALTQSGISKIIPQISLDLTAVRITTHGFRYVIATSATEFMLVDPTLAQQLLHHHSQSVTESFYIQSGRDVAQRDLADIIEARLAGLS